MLRSETFQTTLVPVTTPNSNYLNKAYYYCSYCVDRYNVCLTPFFTQLESFWRYILKKINKFSFAIINLQYRSRSQSTPIKITSKFYKICSPNVCKYFAKILLQFWRSDLLWNTNFFTLTENYIIVKEPVTYIRYRQFQNLFLFILLNPISLNYKT